MDTFDFAIIGAGPAGEAAAFKARELGASAVVIDRLWFGGSCPHIGCLPSKSLLDGAARHAANPATYRWEDASVQRDFMVNRPAGAEEPDDTSHVKALRSAGAVTYR
ncbi:MAG: mercuric reductase, partial [Chloroflexota bacterium]|nr:mercuric reductase [Chloroflexota bacterium]